MEKSQIYHTYGSRKDRKEITRENAEEENHLPHLLLADVFTNERLLLNNDSARDFVVKQGIELNI
ncbi:CLUMA_CG020227, isoform A [Clunio marinus]|uniref:CLUMA_CG020227, isoform A n=1 Tax=Clunio marinus TaxID=568069 RepID=A0A1J1J4C6_9DIPT|nr:CLUMA_CG020227, isoform A [Clunio marinus]